MPVTVTQSGVTEARQGTLAQRPCSPPCSMSESVRCVREKLAMSAGEIENLEQGAGCGQLGSALRGGGGEKYLEAWSTGREPSSSLVRGRNESAEKSSSHSKPPPRGE